MRESFIIYRSFFALIKLLNEKKQNKMFIAIFEYGLDEKEPNFDSDETMNAIWSAIKPQLKANNKRYENGKRGGAPVGNANAEKQPNSEEKNNQETRKKTTKTGQNKTTEKQPNENENVNDNENANENENLTDCQSENKINNISEETAFYLNFIKQKVDETFSEDFLDAGRKLESLAEEIIQYAEFKVGGVARTRESILKALRYFVFCPEELNELLGKIEYEFQEGKVKNRFSYTIATLFNTAIIKGGI